MTGQATTQAQNKHCELAHPSVHLVYELLEHVKETNLQIQNYSIPMTKYKY